MSGKIEDTEGPIAVYKGKDMKYYMNKGPTSPFAERGASSAAGASALHGRPVSARRGGGKRKRRTRRNKKYNKKSKKHHKKRSYKKGAKKHHKKTH